MICNCCGGRGQVIDRLSGRWISCPLCGGPINEARALTAEVIAENSDAYTHNFECLKIPKIYQNLVYYPSVIEGQAVNYYSGDVKTLLNILNRVKQIIHDGFLPEYSIYIHAPNEIDIAVWVYDILKTAVKRGMSAVPYITVKELGYMLNKSETKDLFYEYANAQVCILDLSARSDFDTATTLADILGIRSKKGLPTIVTGYWSYSVISKTDKHGIVFQMTENREQYGLLKCYCLSRKGRKDQTTVVTTPEAPSINTTDFSNYADIVE